MGITIAAPSEFDTHYNKWLDVHRLNRTGEALRRLTDGIGYGEKLFVEQIWWPVAGSFDGLNPEYVIYDEGDRERFIDLAYIRAPYRFAIEIDGYGPHVKDVDRYQFGDGLMRQNQLVMEGWKPIRFSVTDLEQRPDRCIRFIRGMLGQWYGRQDTDASLPTFERQLVELAVFNYPYIDSTIIASELGIHRKNASNWLRKLYAKGLLTPIKSGKRIHRYRYSERAVRLLRK